MTEWAVNCPFHFAASEGDLRSVRQYMEERKNKPEEKLTTSGRDPTRCMSLIDNGRLRGHIIMQAVSSLRRPASQGGHVP